MNEKVCCNCRHNIRKKDKDGRIECECDIDNSYIGYVQCMNYKCRHWAKEKESGEKMQIPTMDEFSKQVAENALNEIMVEIDEEEMTLKEFIEKLKTNYKLVRKEPNE